MSLRVILQVARLLVVRPKLWWTAIRQVFRLAPNGWWYHWPFLPLPASKYMRFRMQTMYGDTRTQPVPEDLISYLEWCHSYPKAGRSRFGRL